MWGFALRAFGIGIAAMAKSTFDYLIGRGRYQADLDTEGLRSLKGSKKDEITLATFYAPLWMFLIGALIKVVGFPEHGEVFIDTAKDTILFLNDAINISSFYGWALIAIIAVSLGLNRVAGKIKVPKGWKNGDRTSNYPPKYNAGVVNFLIDKYRGGD